MSSRLFLNIRERKGLCYFIKASLSGYTDTSGFLVHAGLNKEKIYEALEAIKKELNDVKYKGITKEELQKAKDTIRGRTILKMEQKEIKDLEKKLAELDKITLLQVNKAAKDIVDWKQSNLAIIGTFENKNKFLNILKK